MQEGKTRWTHYCIASHLVWLPKDRRQVLTGEVQQATKELMAECGERHDLKLFALETDLDQVPVFVSTPPPLSPAQMANLLKGDRSRYLRLRFPPLKKGCGRDHRLPPGLLCRNSRSGFGRGDSALHHAVPGQVAPAGWRRFHANPLKGMGIPAPLFNW